MTFVFLTRTQSDNAALAEETKHCSLLPISAPMLEIQFVNQPFGDLDHCDAYVFTSRYGVDGFLRQGAVNTTPTYIVGQAGREYALGHGFHCVDPVFSCAEEMAQQIIADGRKHVFYARGRDIRFDMKSVLLARGIKCEEQIVYRAEKIGYFPAQALEILQAKEEAYALFFSVRAAQNFQELCRKTGQKDALNSIKALCLSDAVLECLDHTQWAGAYVSQEPNTLSLLKMLDEIRHT